MLKPPQFSLRSLLLFVALAGVVAAWARTRVEQKRRERAGAATVRSLGGSLMYDYEMASESDGAPAPPPGPAWIRRLCGDDFLTSVSLVSLERSRATDADLAVVECFPKLQTLDLLDTRVSPWKVRELLQTHPQLVVYHQAQGLLGIGHAGVRGPCIVSAVPAGLPAARAGLERGDVILAVDGRPIGDAHDLSRIVCRLAPGTRVSLRVRRGESVFEAAPVLAPWGARPH